jgi:hypothetical protein
VVTFAQAPPVVVIHEGGGWWSPTAWTAYGTLLLAVVTVVLAVAAWRSTRHTGRALDIAKQQADIAQRHADTAAEAQRASLHPWLSLRDQPATVMADGGLLVVSAVVLSIGPGWARIGPARLELPSGAQIALDPGVGIAKPGEGEKLTAVLPHDDPLAAEMAATEFPTLVVECTNVHGEEAQAFEWVRVGSEWVRSVQAIPADE